MSNDEIVRLISNNDCRVRSTQSFREKPWQLQSRVRRPRPQRCLGRIQDNAGRARFNVIEQPRKTVAREPEQTVIKVKIIDINRFIFRRPNRERVKIPNRNAAERISLNPEISLQIFLCRIIQHDFSPDRQQNWPMKNEKEPHAYREANHHSPPDVSVTPA